MSGRSAFHLRGNRLRQRGAIFITALGIIVILSGLVLVFAQDMRTEALASANRLAYIQADAVERGAEQWVLAQVESSSGDATTITDTPAEAIQISGGSAQSSGGGGYFWLLRPNPDNDQQYDFGITDESGKLNINSASLQQLLMFPGMTQEAAEAIVDWRDPNGAAGTDALYSALPDPYVAKHSDYETVEELLLVDGVTPEMMYGNDRNRDGVVDDAERAIATNTGSMFASGDSSDRGLIHYLTAYSAEPESRLNLDSLASASQFQSLLTSAGISAARASTIASSWQAERRRGGRFRNLAAFNARVRTQPAEIKLFADKVKFTGSTAPLHRINVSTAARDTLMCLQRIDESDVDKLISARDGADTSSIAWVFDALGTSKALDIVNSITARSFQYSADIVATSGDGRAYKRVRIVVDSRESPPKIVYRKELTGLGWPLPAAVRESLRSGKGVVAGYARTSGTGARL